MHDSAFTWRGASHALLHQKCFITWLQVAGSVPREQLEFGDPVSAHPANPSISRLLSCCRGKRPFVAAQRSAPKSYKAPGLASGSTKPSSMAKKKHQ